MINKVFDKENSFSLIPEKTEYSIYRESEMISYYQTVSTDEYNKMSSIDNGIIRNLFTSNKILFFIMFYILLSSNSVFAGSKIERDFKESILLNPSVRNTLNYSYTTSLLIGLLDILELSNIQLKPYISTIGYIGNVLFTFGKCYYVHIKKEWIKESNFSSFLFTKFKKN